MRLTLSATSRAPKSSSPMCVVSRARKTLPEAPSPSVCTTSNLPPISAPDPNDGGTDAGRLTVAPQSVSITFAWMAGSRRLRMSSARGRSASGISCRRRMARSTVSGGGADMEG